jgi:hypothetical protein
MTNFQAPAEHPVDIFVHVPKTAGISLRSEVITHYGGDRTWVYSSSSDLYFRADRQLYHPEKTSHIALRGITRYLPGPVKKGLLVARDKIGGGTDAEEAYAKADAIIGHFKHDAFEDCPVAREERLFTVVREPLSRIVSHYRYLQQSHKMGSHVLGWMQEDDPSLPFSEFALSEHVRNLQTRYTGCDPTKYADIGTTEKFDAFLHRTNLMDQEATSPWINMTVAPDLDDPILHDAGFQKDFQTFHAADYEFYEAAVNAQSR